MEELDKKQTKDRTILDLERLGFNNFRVVGHYNYRSVMKNLEMHLHKGMIEIIYLAKGHQHYKIADREYVLKGGDVLVIPPDTIHGTGIYPEDIGSLYWIIFRIPSKKKRLLNLTPSESLYIAKQFLKLQFCHFKGNAKMETTLARIFKFYNPGQKTKSKVQLTSLLLQFVLEVIDASKRNSLNNSTSPEMVRVIKYIDNHLLDDLSIERLADLSNLSTSRFKHRFKKEVGIPPGEFIIRKKIDFAKSYSSQYKSIQSLAFSLGFSSSNYFASVFKKFTGSTPSDYFMKQKRG